MAELAAAGSVVGLLSLGIQSCQGLISYCSTWSSYDQRIRETQRNTEELKIICENLRRGLWKVQQREEPVGQQVVRLIMSCEEGIESLHDAWGKCQPGRKPCNLITKVKLQRARALYPFKEQALRTLEENVHRVKENLASALQVLHLYVAFIASELDCARTLNADTSQLIWSEK